MEYKFEENSRQHVKYLPLEHNEEGNNFLKLKAYYDKGGFNGFTHKTRRRGYYVSATPVRKESILESFTGFSGYTILVEEVNLKVIHPHL